MSRWSIGIVALALCVTSCVTHAARADEPTLRIQAKRVRDFVDFLGVNTHFSQNTPPYRDGQKSAADMRYLGIHVIRDGCTVAPASVRELQQLVRNGIRMCAVYDGGTVEQTVAAARRLAGLGPAALLSIEGPNEINNQTVTYQGRTTRFAPLASGGTFLPAAQLQADLYAAIRREPELATVPVWHLTSGGAEPDNCGLQFLQIPAGSGARMPDGTVFADVANIHVYASGGRQAQGSQPDEDLFRKELIDEYGLTWGRKHFRQDSYRGYPTADMTFATVVTEFGYHTNPAASADGVDRATQAKNLLNAMLGAWAEGYRGFFIYELYDAATDASDLSNYGLFDTQGRPKPSGRAIHALTALLADRGPDATTFNPGTIAMTLSGLSATARWTTLQDSEGAYRFIIWNNAPNWDAASRQPMTVLPRTVTLELARSWSRVTIFDPVQGTDAVRHFANVKRITLSLTDHPLVVAVSERDSK